MSTELKRLHELVPGNENYKYELSRIRDEKVKEIRHTIRRLLATHHARTTYDGDKTILSFLWEDTFPRTPIFNIDIEKFLSNAQIQ